MEIRKLIRKAIVLQMSYRWYKTTKYYHIHLQPNLFGGISVIRSWGGISSNKSGHKITMCDSEEQASEIVLATIKRRMAKGYLPC